VTAAGAVPDRAAPAASRVEPEAALELLALAMRELRAARLAVEAAAELLAELDEHPAELRFAARFRVNRLRHLVAAARRAAGEVA